MLDVVNLSAGRVYSSTDGLGRLCLSGSSGVRGAGAVGLSLSLFLSLSLSHTHTHTHSLSYMLSVSTVILLHGYSMYIKHCCSVGSFGAKLICILDKFVLFKYINLLILCLSLDLPDVITSICAGQL